MKKFLAFILCIVMLLSVVSCAAEEKATETQPAPENQGLVTPPADTEETKEEEVKKTEEKGEVVYDKVSDPLTTARVEAIPVANSSMTTDELRQICIDYVKLSVSFQWVPNQDFDYQANQGGGTPVAFKEGKLHGGIPYVNVASGNVYRILEYYNQETGVLDVRFLSKNTLLFGTACSGTTDWGWHRVVNSCKLSWTANMTQANGLIVVGSYTYDPNIKRFGEDGAMDCKDIAKANGKKVMFESYAATLPGDCMVNNGHVRMTAEKPVVVYNEDGSINGEKSYIVHVEQGLFTTGEYHKRVSADGIEYVIQGNEGKKGDGSPYYYTFDDMYETGYLPHTFKEFLGLDPVEKAEATTNIEGDRFTAKVGELKGKTLTANYVISHVITTVYDSEGKEVLRYMKMVHPHYLYTADLDECVPLSALQQYQAKGGYTVTISAFLGNGECIVAYEGELATA